MMRKRDYLRGKASIAKQAPNIFNKPSNIYVDYTLRKLKSDYYTKRLRTIKIILEICGYLEESN